MAIGLALVAAGCYTPRVAMKPGASFSAIASIALIEQDRVERQNVTDEMARQLIRRGYSVRVLPDRSKLAPESVWMQVSVTQYTPDKKYLVQLNDDAHGHGRRDVVVLNSVTEVSGRGLYPSISPPGMDDAQILVSNATVSLSARLMEQGTGEILWSGAVTYEGLDLDAAVEGSVASLLKQLPPRQ